MTPTLYTIGLIVIGAILLIIVGAFVLSAPFRRDVIAAEGEASVLGLLNVKGVVIILLTAIFAGAFIYIIRGERSAVDPVGGGKTDTVSYKVASAGPARRFMASDKTLCEASALLKACHRNVSVTVRQEYPVSGIQGFYYRVDSVWYTGERGKQYQYRIAFGERNPEGTIVWAADPLYIHKTANGSIASGSTFEEVGDHRWSRQYSVLMGLGQPDSLMNHIEKAFLVVASTEVNMTKQ